MSQFMVTGLSDLRNALIRADKAEPKQVRAMLRTVSAVVVDRARPRMASLIHDPRSTGRLEASMKPASTVRSASIVLGTPKRTAYAGWWEFGGPRRPSRRPPNRDFIKQGRTLYPTLAESRPEIQAQTEWVVEQLAMIAMS